jgi:hypothetical protein
MPAYIVYHDDKHGFTFLLLSLLRRPSWLGALAGALSPPLAPAA